MQSQLGFNLKDLLDVLEYFTKDTESKFLKFLKTIFPCSSTEISVRIAEAREVSWNREDLGE